ncbi:108_t:CDS:2, partial [Racocetra persica]
KIISTNMLPPPPATYQSANELLKNIQAFANSQGGVYNSSEIQQKQTSTQSINCSFELKFAWYNGKWYIKKVRNCDHNHNLSEDISGHLIVRRLTKQQLDNVTEMTIFGSCFREIILAICQNDLSAFVISKDIYNTRE